MDYNKPIFNSIISINQDNIQIIETGFSPEGKPINYEWWDQRARDETPLTEAEKNVIYKCGGLCYLRTIGEESGFDCAKLRTVSEKHYFDCVDNCVCGRHDIE